MATNATKATNSKTPTSIGDLDRQEPKPSTEMAPVASAQDREMLARSGAKLLTRYQVHGSVPIFCTNDKALDLALTGGAQGLLDQFAQADAVESTYAAVIVGIRNAVMTSLYSANRDEGRNVELALAFKGAAVLARLLEAYDAHRGHGRRRFTVGNVNVEPGAQAIVGNVETMPRQEPRIEEAGVKANKHKPRAA